MKKFLNNLDEVQIVPAPITTIRHRSECLPYYDAFWSEDGGGWSLCCAHLPLFTAPMSCVVNDENYRKFDMNNIVPIIPRTVPYERRIELMQEMIWVAMGLEEFKTFYRNTDKVSDAHICVDVANGHMSALIDACREAKLLFGQNLVLMAGNIANPETYKYYAEAGIDYVRVAIGSGGACATNTLTGIGYDAFHLLQNIRQEKNRLEARKNYITEQVIPKIVYDGGCDSIRDIIIALALGADYVMCGKLFAQAFEAAGKIVNDSETSSVGRMYYGMSTERAQREMGKTKIRHSEGVEYWVPIKYTLKEFTSQFEAAICSTMSYCNTTTLEDFIGKVKVIKNDS